MSIKKISARMPAAACPVCAPLRSWIFQPFALAQYLKNKRGFFWLDSGDEGLGWSYLGFEPVHRAQWDNGNWVVKSQSGVQITAGPAFEGLQRQLDMRWQKSFKVDPVPGEPPFKGGWLANFSYDLGREIETVPKTGKNDLQAPGIRIAFYETVFAYDHDRKIWWCCQLASAGAEALDKMEHELSTAVLTYTEPNARQAEPFDTKVKSNFTKTNFKRAVRKALGYIRKGDIYQVNLSQRLEAPWHGTAFDLYKRLREESPALYGAFVDMGDGFSVCSVSPELFLSRRARKIVTRPIKGTRPRGDSPEEDAHLASELMRSPKEKAELVMIVDLERNDLGRVCEYGSIRVEVPSELETHPTVLHQVATVTGTLREGLTNSELLRATFPGGSVTGAPKIRAMQIIEELEPTWRGAYCGALGWIGANGDLDLNLPIRTALVDSKMKKAWYQAGSGIVADSDPDHEYEETLVKARAFYRAVGADVP